MSLERDIKEALERRAGDVTPSPAAWRDVERRVRRGHRVRVLAGAIGAAAAVAAAAVVVPQVLERPAPSFVAPGPEEGGTAGWLRYRDETDAYRLAYPPDWQRSMFEGVVEFRPQGFPASAAGEDGVYVTILREAGSHETGGFSAPGGAEVEGPDAAEVGGRPATRAETRGPDGRHSVQYRIDWTGLGCAPDAEDCSDPANLRVVIDATTEALWTAHGATAERVVSSIEAVLADGRPTEEGPVETRRGEVGEGVTYDALTAGLVRFLDARLEGGRAELWLGDDARRQYEKPRPPAQGLYASGEQVWLGYEIRERADADANSAEFTVLVRVLPTEGDPTSGFTETIGVGPGATVGGNELPAIIRFTRFVGTEATAQSPGSAGS